MRFICENHGGLRKLFNEHNIKELNKKKTNFVKWYFGTGSRQDQSQQGVIFLIYEN